MAKKSATRSENWKTVIREADRIAAELAAAKAEHEAAKKEKDERIKREVAGLQS